MPQEVRKIKIRSLWLMLGFSAILMGFKFAAYLITHSNAILSDALESIINVVAGGFALSSMYYASRPRDEDHPYGHGKAENLSAGFEGGLVFIAGISIIGRGVYGFFKPVAIESLDIGVLITGFAGLCNFIMGNFLLRKGKKYNSLLMKADGKHLISDTVSSLGLIAGLTVIYFTGIYWIDNLMAIIFGGYIFYTGITLVKESVNGLLDEADYEKLNQLIGILNVKRRTKWVDIHNLRMLKYGPQLHFDAHITLPWYLTLEESHEEVIALEKIVKENLDGEMEFFIHADPCLESSCPICPFSECRERKSKFVKKLDWTLGNVLPNKKHILKD